MGWRTKLQKAKQLHRPSLKDWECDGLYQQNKFPSYLDYIQNTPSEQYTTFYIDSPSTQQQQFLEKHSNMCGSRTDYAAPSVESSSVSSTSSSRTSNGALPVETMSDSSNTSGNNNTRKNDNLSIPSLPVILDAKILTTSEFRANYESNNIPCIIKNIPNGFDNASYTGQPWPAIQQWIQCIPLQPDQYHRNTPLRERLFKCGEDDNGKSIKVRLKYFLKYMYHNLDDSPLYIFDSSFEKDVCAKSLLHDYVVPSYFQCDLFNYISEKRRPPYRWILIGPQRSGSCIHIDPLSTNAWNTLLHGQKRWVLFPPHVPKYVVKGKGLIGPKEDDEAIHYFMFILPRIKRRAQQVIQEQPNHPDYQGFVCYEFTQNPNETVFVPNGWWHAVLNITNTIGVTQNYAAPCNMENIWIKVRKDRPRMASKLLLQLQKHDPPLYEHAVMLNERDKFCMKYDPFVIKERQQKSKVRGDDRKENKKQRHNV
jgi:histone arginine demethylase JMJD6